MEKCCKIAGPLTAASQLYLKQVFGITEDSRDYKNSQRE